MKHLKAFNESNSNYYEEIPSIISQNLITPNREKIDENEYNIILKKIKDTFGKCGSIYKETSLSLTFGTSPNNTALYEILVIKYPDEWYYLILKPNKHYLNLIDQYFKCDQFDGLLKCLDDILPTCIK